MDFEFGIIGGGISGLGVGAALKRAGMDDFAIFERAGDVGGTWRDNRYPGVAVDIPCFAYQFSYFRKPDWSRLFAPGAEVKQYIDDFTDHFGLRPHLRLNTDVKMRTWDEGAHLWRLTLGDDSEVTVRYCVGAIGAFCEPLPVEFPGFADFEGTVLRSSRWDDSYDLTGKRVACIGTGASGLQLIPEVAQRAARVDVYQRTPIWVAPKSDPAFSPRFARLLGSKAVYRLFCWVVELFVIKLMTNHSRVPWVVPQLRKAVLKHHVDTIPDAATRDKLTPKYEYACKRPSFSNTYLPTLQSDHVDVVTAGIERFTADGIVDAEGVERQVDAVVLATGFINAFDPRLYELRPVRGRDGFDLATHWRENRLSAYQGITAPGLPNHFHVFGPYAGIAGTFHPLIEVAGEHIVRVVREARRRGATAVEVKPEPAQAYHERMLRKMTSALWYNERSCDAANTYYFATHGDVLLVRPDTTKEALRLAREAPIDDYAFETAAA